MSRDNGRGLGEDVLGRREGTKDKGFSTQSGWIQTSDEADRHTRQVPSNPAEGSWWKGKDLKVSCLDFEFESNRITVNFRVIKSTFKKADFDRIS